MSNSLRETVAALLAETGPSTPDASCRICGGDGEHFDDCTWEAVRSLLAGPNLSADDELRAASDAATPGLWRVDDNSSATSDAHGWRCTVFDAYGDGTEDPSRRAAENAEFIVAAVNHVRSALATPAPTLPLASLEALLARWQARAVDPGSVAVGLAVKECATELAEVIGEVGGGGGDERELRAMQDACAAYASNAWPDLTIEVEALALAEEVGELARCVVKRHHGNRGTAADWTAELRREAGDVLLVLCNLASIEGFDLADAGAERLAVILARDIDHDPVGASAPTTPPAATP